MCINAYWAQGWLSMLACGLADDPIHLPHLIGPMKHYLWILKTTHGGADMDTCLEMAKGALDGEPCLSICVPMHIGSNTHGV